MSDSHRSKQPGSPSIVVDVCLLVLDADSLLRLRDVAVADADPLEVMPPSPGGSREETERHGAGSGGRVAEARRDVAGSSEGPPGWTTERQRAFVEFFTPMLDAVDITIYGIMVGEQMAGFIRLKRLDKHTGETGIWLGRSWRKRGVATAALGELLKAAFEKGLTRVVADTLPANKAAQALLRAHGARLREDSGKIYAELIIDPAYAADLDK